MPLFTNVTLTKEIKLIVNRTLKGKIGKIAPRKIIATAIRTFLHKSSFY